MNTMKDNPTSHSTAHPTKDTLLAYLEAADQADFAAVRLHIASCGDCRVALQRLNNLQHTLQTTGPYQNRLQAVSAQLTSALEQQSIERYVDGELHGMEAVSVKQMLNADPTALKAALHYACQNTACHNTAHSAGNAQRNAAAADARKPAPASRSRNHPFIEQLKRLLDFRPPVWISVPATAAAVIMMTLAIMPGGMHSAAPGFTVAGYQDKPVIHFQGADQLPGIGFFNKARRSTETFGPVDIQYNGEQTLALRWPAVPNATHYHLAVYLISEGRKITVQEMDLAANQATIANFNAQTGKRYEWTLNGETGDARSFYTSGGFVITNDNDGS
ncbi:MAG: hypothetical protein PVF34_08620 [Gammaproteobacteria bacterium]|jgi:hypothetical protein|nr:hypothetical protein [Gammaproteobacteria bacterium]